VGNTPKAVAVADGVAYVTNFGDNTLSVVTLAGLVPQVFTVPNVGDGPWGVGLIGQDIYVSSFNNNKLLRLRQSNGAYTVTDLGLNNVSKPRHLHINEQKIYVASSGNNKLLIVDAASELVTAESFDVAADPYDVTVRTSKVYVTSNSSGKVSRMELNGSDKREQPAGTTPRGLEYYSGGSRIIVAAYGENKINQIDEVW